MARTAITNALTPQRPPILASLSLVGVVALLGPKAPAAAVDLEAPGPKPHCMVAGERHGELYVPEGHWTMPVLPPSGHFRTPILGPQIAASEPILDVDAVVAALRKLVVTPHT